MDEADLEICNALFAVQLTDTSNNKNGIGAITVDVLVGKSGSVTNIKIQKDEQLHYYVRTVDMCISKDF